MGTPAAQQERWRHRLTVDDFHKMGEAGILAPDARVELIEGEVIDMTPIGSRHAGLVKRLNDVLTRQVQGKAIVALQDPVVLGEESEPQPDLMVLHRREDYYAAEHPGPGDVLLLIEVADSTVAYDRDVKIPLYARHGIGEVWLVDLEEQRIEAYHHPQGGEYRHVDVHRTGRLVAQHIAELSVALDTLFPLQK